MDGLLDHADVVGRSSREEPQPVETVRPSGPGRAVAIRRTAPRAAAATATASTDGRPPPFPFSAIVAQEEMKRALLLAAIDPTIGGVLIFGDRGTGKSTAVRALAALLPLSRAAEAFDMAAGGYYRRVVAVDFSAACVAQMRARAAARAAPPGASPLAFEVADVRDLRAFADASFDCVLDKGTFDSILCGDGSKAVVRAILEADWRISVEFDAEVDWCGRIDGVRLGALSAAALDEDRDTWVASLCDYGLDTQTKLVGQPIMVRLSTGERFSM